MGNITIGGGGQYRSEADYMEAISAKRNRFKHSSCSSGWSTTAYTGWYIMGTAAQVRKSIMILLSIVTASNGPCLMASLAQVWFELRDNPIGRQLTTISSTTPGGGGGGNGSSFNYLNGAIDLVVAPVSIQQRQLIRLISSLSPMFSLETLIQTIRSTMKNHCNGNGSSSLISNVNLTGTTTTTSSSTTTSSATINGAATSSSASTFYLMEISLLELTLAYIRTYPGAVLLKSWRSIMSLVKDCQTMNVQASIPISVIQSATGNVGINSFANTSTVSVNVQPLVNFHLLAILHEFLFITPLCEDRRAQKEMQDVANKLIESLISVAGARLSHSRWTLKRNLEVLPMTGGCNVNNLNHETIITHQKQGSFNSTGSSNKSDSNINVDMIDSSSLNLEQSIGMKRGLFRSSASVSFNEHSRSNNNQDNQDSLFNGTTIESMFSDTLFSGLFTLGYPTGSSSSMTASSVGDLVNSAQLLFDNFFCVKALYALSEVIVLLSF